MRPFLNFEYYVRRLCHDAIYKTSLSIVIPPDFNFADKLFAGHKRTIRPDIKLCNSDKDVVALIDSKRRDFRNLSNVAGDYTVSPEILYRMAFYMNHFRKPGAIMHGIFVVPSSTELPVFEQAVFDYDNNLIVTLLGIKINQAQINNDYSNNLSEYEEEFKNRLKQILEIEYKAI
ncbi:hypothetical protein [Candidatus Magnetaquicoccus inordinatus]|uniref:hypothetical protein n=1 Tax=Candidatus Magnetaquicoccus inordinatus TaxID=2496818 RepID=UPI00102BB53C|nr:hypothetical protein [Candidatus Magnetaquicoccus inordinatus]